MMNSTDDNNVITAPVNDKVTMYPDRKRALEALLTKAAGDKTDYRLRVLYTAAIDPNVTPAALQQLVLRQMDSVWTTGKCHDHSQMYFSLLMGTTQQNVSLAEKCLIKAGYLSSKKPSRGNSRVNIIPPHFVSSMVQSVISGGCDLIEIISQWTDSVVRNGSRHKKTVCRHTSPACALNIKGKEENKRESGGAGGSRMGDEPTSTSTDGTCNFEVVS
jgi:hypothetical protein